MSNEKKVHDAPCLNKVLTPGETVLWKGRPTGIRLFEPPFNTSTLINWCICLAMFGLMGYYLYYSSASGYNMTQAIQVVVLASACVIFAAISPLKNVKSLESSYRYYITDQRFITIKAKSDDDDAWVEWRSLEDVTEVGIDVLSTGKACLYINPIGRGLAKKARKGIHQKNTEDYKREPLFFYSIGDVQGALNALPSAIVRTRNWSKRSAGQTTESGAGAVTSGT